MIVKIKQNGSTLNFGRKLKYILILAVLANFLLNSACKKLLDIPASPTAISSGNIFSSDLTAIGALNGMYRTGVNFDNFIPFNTSLLADELSLFRTDLDETETQYYQNALSETSSLPWTRIYGNIFSINLAIEGLNSSSTLTPSVKSQLLGEAKFLRAFNYFYAVNLFGNVPLALSSDYEQNRLLHRSTIAEVYEVMIKDLIEAQSLLSKSYLSGSLKATTTDRVRPSYWAATALLARVYLYKGEFAKAVEESSMVIANCALFSLPQLNNAFLKNSTETIWAIELDPSAFNTVVGGAFVPTASNIDYLRYHLSDYLFDSFEAGDARKTNWIVGMMRNNITYYFPYKYKAGDGNTVVTEYEVVLRLGEQFLIRAEAQAMLNSNLGNAIADLNAIRTRARATATAANPNPLPNLAGNLNQAQVITAVEHERQTELFTEWANRWFDLKRMKGISDPSKTRADEVMPAITQSKGGSWNANWKLLPIPQNERLKNPSMLNEQNPGY